MKKTLSFLSFIFLSIFLHAQQIATLPDGQKVILNQDGTWHYETPTPEPDVTDLDCDDLVITETDRVSGDVLTGSSGSIIASQDGGKNGIAITLINSGKSVILSGLAISERSGCIDDDAKINILFRDGTRREIENFGKFSCEGRFLIYLGGLGGKANMEALATKEVEIMRVTTRRSYVEETFDPGAAMRLMKTIACLRERL